MAGDSRPAADGAWAAFPAGVTSLFGLLGRGAALFGADPYLLPTETGLDEISYAGLRTFTCSFADYLDEQGAPVGASVASAFHNSTLAALLFVATIAARRVYVPLNPKMGEGEIAHILRQTKPALTIHHAEHAARFAHLPDAGALAVVPDEAAFVKAIFARAPRPETARELERGGFDDPAEVVFTSGSTGLPKGAVLSHRNLLRNAFAMAASYGVGRGTRFLTACPLFHNSGQLPTTLTALWCGGLHVAVRSDFAMMKFWYLVDRYRIEWTVVMNAYLALLVQRPERPRHGTMRGILAGGSKLKRDLVENFERTFGVPVYQIYGLTETTAISTSERPGRGAASIGSAGTPLPGCRIRIVSDGRDVPPGEHGEILIAGEHVFSHYVNQPDVTAEKLVDGWLHTGDLGYLDGEGNVFIVDRLDSMIHVGGENVYPSEIEKLSTLLAGVEDMVVTELPNPILGAELVLVYKAQAGQQLDPSGWSEILGKHVSTFKIPKRRVTVEEIGLDAIPRGPNGKLLRAKIRAAVHDAYASQRT